MAEGGFDPCTSQTPKIQQQCRYFIHGACFKGENCRFIHDRSGTVPANNICKFYQQGKCSYGNRCRYDHVRPNHSDLQETISQNKNNGRQRNPSADSFTNSDGRRRRNDSDDWKPSLVTLKKDHNNSRETGRAAAADNRQSGDGGYKTRVFKKNWVKAKDFVPGQKFHAGATYANRTQDPDKEDIGSGRAATTAGLSKEPREEDLMCPYYAHGHCPYGRDCSYIHGDVCDVCQMPRLHPTDMAQREEHSKECLNQMEKDMEHSFAIQESQKKECCICLEIVLEKADKDPGGASNKANRSNQFGILENCTHCFCLMCIRRWRSDKTSFGKNVRVCPICRVHSDFVTPSSVWVEEEEPKKKVIQDYKDALRLKSCQYFKQGKGECPFNEKCFYKHAYPDGSIAEPKPRKKPRRKVNSDGELSLMETISLWDFLERREDGLISLEDELSLYLLGMLGDSDDDNDFWLFGGLSQDSSDSYDDF